jgi:hypothetical protein
MKYTTVLLAILALGFCLPSRADVSPEKRKEVETLIRLTGLEKLMNQMKEQMLASMKASSPQVTPQLLARLSAKLDVREVLEKIIPIYDKYYSLEDLRAVNAFYSSPAGQKILGSLPQVMQECMAAGQAWGENAGKQLGAELEAEAAGKAP